MNARTLAAAVRRSLSYAAIIVPLITVSVPARAQFPQLPTTGVCAVAVNLNYPFSYLWGNSPGTGYGVSALETIDFGASTVNLNIIEQNPNTNPNLVTEQAQTVTAPFIKVSGPIPGSYIVAFNVDGSTLSQTASNDEINQVLIPVNDGNVMLVQGANPLATEQGNSSAGSCQMQYFGSSNFNTQLGTQALFNTTGTYNTGIGFNSLFNDTTGYDNNGIGANALYSNTAGNFNNGVGFMALYFNTTGSNNNAQGSYALSANTTGYGNSAMGANSLMNLTTGFRNVGVGNNTGTYLAGGSYNVDIGWGVSGLADETGVVRIGNPTYATTTYIAGILGNAISGSTVVINANGQLGVLSSSERYKTDIASFSAEGSKLQQLRPVSFHLKTEPDGALQYGLIAEEVDKVYPALVIRDAQGTIQGVRYDELAPILLSQVQQLQRTVSEQQRQLSDIDQLKQRLAQLEQTNDAMQIAMTKLLAKDDRTAMR